VELGRLVEEEDPRWARLISPGWPLAHQPPLVEEAGDRMDHADLQRLGGILMG
jgi:hypothetical protein